MKEVRVLASPVKASSNVDVAWAYPNSYSIGMSGLGYQLIWWLLEQDVETNVFRVFSDYQETGWQNAQLLGFTLSWELDCLNVLAIVKKMDVSLLSKERQEHDPLIFAGGPAIAANPEPYAEFFDFILIGDAEVLIPKLLSAYKEIKSSSRSEKLEFLAKIDGIYVPSLYQYHTSDEKVGIVKPVSDDIPAQIKKQVFIAPDDYVAHSVILSDDTSWGSTFLVEVVRSCPQECRFCLASYLTRPFRGANVDALMNKIDIGLKYTKKIGLLGPSVTEHPNFSVIAKELLKRPQISISIASIRVDTIEDYVLEMLYKLGQKSVTMAIESGSERLRAIMKKNLSEEQIFNAVQKVEASGLKAIKFYGIVGLPGEIDSDLEETVRLLTKLKKTFKQIHFIFGVSSFVPKAQTPFQFFGRDKNSSKKLEYLRKNLAKIGIEVRTESSNWSDIQALLSRSDRKASKIIMSVFNSKANLGAWKQAIRAHKDEVDSDYYIFSDFNENALLPWKHLVDDAKEKILLRHSKAAQELALSELKS
jgi:radical SAM superfamily enzyme YgiQ (UPF0313 family)